MKGLFVSPSLTIMPMQAWFVRLAGKNRLLEKEIKIFFISSVRTGMVSTVFLLIMVILSYGR